MLKLEISVFDIIEIIFFSIGDFNSQIHSCTEVDLSGAASGFLGSFSQSTCEKIGFSPDLAFV